jgi:hypothetical protein
LLGTTNAHNTLRHPLNPTSTSRTKVTVARYYASRVGIPITVHNTDLRTIDGTVVSKVETQLPKQVGLLRRVMPKGLALEADVPFERRVRIDLDWKTSDTYNVAYFDLETATRDFDGFKEGTIIGASVVSQGVSEVYVAVSLTSLNGFQTWLQSTGLNS